MAKILAVITLGKPLSYENKPMPEIRKITAQETFAVRHPVLRKGKPLESCRFDGDELPTTTHFGLFENEELVGVISAFTVRHSYFEAAKQMQLRGMAILEKAQRKGYGQLLLAHCEQVLKDQDLIWFNARENAVAFYQKMEYTVLGSPFDIPEIGKHYVMFKKNNRRI